MRDGDGVDLRLSRGRFLRLVGGGALAVSLPGGLAACGQGTSQAGGGGGAGLRLIGVADQKPALDAVLPDFDGAKVDASYAPTDQVQTSVRAQLGAGNPPDVHVVYPGSGSSMSMVDISGAGLLTDLSDQAWTQEIPDALRPAFESEGKVYVQCAGSSVIGAIYNKAVFEEVGVEVPTTWSALLDVCAKLKAAGKTPIALGAGTQWVTQLINYALVPSTVYVDDPDFDAQQRAGKASFADSGWRTAFEKYVELQKEGFFNDNVNGTTFEQTQAALGKGEAGMVVQVSAVLPAYTAAAGGADKLGMFPLPAVEEAADNWVPAGVLVGFGVSAKSQRLKDAKALTEYLGKPEVLNRYAKAVYAVPLVSDGTTEVDPLLKPFEPLIADGRSVPFMDQRWPNPEVQPAHFAAVQQVLGGQASVSAALKSMDDAYRKS